MLLARGAGAPFQQGFEALKRGIEFHLKPQGLNDGDSAGNPLTGYARGVLAHGLSASTAQLMKNTAGGGLATYRIRSGRRCIGWFSTAGQNTVWTFSPIQDDQHFYLDVGVPNAGAATFIPTTQVPGVLPTPQYGWAMSISAWCCKNAGGDGSSGRMSFGYANNRVVGGSKAVPRCGLIGDGVGGYGYGSVNAPDGVLAGGNNGDTDRDAGFVQPADIVNPGTNFWHSRIKLVPATPVQPARWAAYHNGILVATFANESNFGFRGHQGVSDAYTLVEATIGNWSGDVAGLHVPELCFTDIRFMLEDDYTV